jgi:branched-chain amino acid transport system substrate-binding protein
MGKCIQKRRSGLPRCQSSLLAAGLACAGLGCHQDSPPPEGARLTSAGASAESAAAKPVVIGGIMPLSGPFATVGQAWTRGWELYWDKVNEGGGLEVGGTKHPVKFLARDSKFDAEAAASSAKKLVFQDGAQFVFGELTNAAANAIQSVTSKEKVVSVVPWIAQPNSDGDVSPTKPYVVRPFISSTDSVEMDYGYLSDQWPGLKKVAVIGWLGNEPNLDFAVGVAKKRGYNVVSKESYTIATQDFAPLFTKVLASKPEVIHLNSWPTAGYLLRAARQAGFKGPVFSDSPLDPLVIEQTAGKENSDNVFCNGMDRASPTPEMKEVTVRWQKKYKEDFVTDAWAAWDTAWVLHQAITKAGTLDTKLVVEGFDHLNKPGDVKTVFGDGYMTGKSTFGVDRVLSKPIPISRIDHGEIKLVGLRSPEPMVAVAQDVPPRR